MEHSTVVSSLVCVALIGILASDANVSAAAVASLGETRNESLTYSIGYEDVPHPGAKIILISKFSNAFVSSGYPNVAQLQPRITQVSLTLDFYNSTAYLSGLPMSLSVGESRTLNITIIIPPTVRAGDHRLTAIATWESFHGWDNSCILYYSCYEPKPSLILAANLPIVEITTQETLAIFLANYSPFLLGYGAFVVGIILLVSRHEREKQRELRWRHPSSGK